jgi:hypothetical protein
VQVEINTNVMLPMVNFKLSQELFKDVMTEILALLIPVMQKPTNAYSPELFAKITTCVQLENA